ncbi:MAG: UBP-type zinc finger domain-containing protein [Sphingobium sp.]|nr:UBP-type zinc finger domain-containing protein [Sphingobium sp.]
MAEGCDHASTVNDVIPQTLGCAECLAGGSWWVHLRLCRTCGHVGCCDDSPNRHATAHFHATGHPIIEGYDPPEGWGWCYVDEVEIDFGGDTTPQRGPIPRFVDSFGRLIQSAIQGLSPKI